MRFKGTDTYVATEDLRVAVNAAIALERPLLVKGEPGTGKTILAHEIAKALGTHTHHLAHQVDDQGAAGALRVRRGGAPARRPARRRRACTTSPTTSCAASCGRPSRAETRPVLLIDEIDKADIEFPNDLLLELDRMEFYVYETRETVVATPAADRRHHLQQREGAARRLPAPLLLPLHPLPRPRDDGRASSTCITRA